MARRDASYTATGEVIQEESSWRYPLTILAVTLLLSGVLLYVYVGPDARDLAGENPRPTVSDEVSRVGVGDVTLDVPANHVLLPRYRRPGTYEALPLVAAWPRMEGYTPARKTDFVENRADSRRLDVVLEEKGSPFTEAQRLEVLYLPQTIGRQGTPAEHGLLRYAFRQGTPTQPASGYADKVMYLGQAEDGAQAVLFCYAEREDAVVPPDCYRQYDLTGGVTVKYYFKAPYLPEWREIDARVRGFVEGLRAG